MANAKNQQMNANMLMVRLNSESWCMTTFQQKGKTIHLQDKKDKELRDPIEDNLILGNKETIEDTDSRETIMTQGIGEIIENRENLERGIETIEIIGIDINIENTEIIDRDKDSIENTENLGREEIVVMKDPGIEIGMLSVISSTEVTRSATLTFLMAIFLHQTTVVRKC